jgi:hypothetical protein
VTPVETAYLGGDALLDRRQSRIRHDKTHFPQPSAAPAHHFHPFGGCSHFDLRASSAAVTRYGRCGNSLGEAGKDGGEEGIRTLDTALDRITV